MGALWLGDGHDVAMTVEQYATSRQKGMAQQKQMGAHVRKMTEPIGVNT